MSIQRMPSVIFEQAWTDYQRVCRQEGMVPLIRFCESRDVPVQRLYEWLRRRNISVKQFQSQFSAIENEGDSHNDRFIQVSVGPADGAHEMGLCVEGVQIEGAKGKLTVRVERMSISAFTRLLNTVKDMH